MKGQLAVHHLTSELWGSVVSPPLGQLMQKKAWQGVIYYPVPETESNLYSFRKLLGICNSQSPVLSPSPPLLVKETSHRLGDGSGFQSWV